MRKVLIALLLSGAASGAAFAQEIPVDDVGMPQAEYRAEARARAMAGEPGGNEAFVQRSQSRTFEAAAGPRPEMAQEMAMPRREPEPQRAAVAVAPVDGAAMMRRWNGGEARAQAPQPVAIPQAAPVPEAAQQMPDRGNRGNWGNRGGGNGGANNGGWNRGGGDAGRTWNRGGNQGNGDAGRTWNRGGSQGDGNANRNWQGRGNWGTPQRAVPVPAPQPGSSVDRNRDGRVDRYYDRNRNGRVDRNWDRNRDGNLDRRWDGNRDGNLDRRWDRNNNDRLDRRWDRNRDGRYDNRRWNDNRWNDGRGYGGWDRGWRNDRRYDWNSHRNRFRHYYSVPRYYNPYGYGYGYNRFSIGIFLDSLFYSSRYWINDPWYYRLPAAPYGTRWVRYYNDVILVDMDSGYVIDVIHNFFW